MTWPTIVLIAAVVVVPIATAIIVVWKTREP